MYKEMKKIQTGNWSLINPAIIVTKQPKVNQSPQQWRG
jgi:hypothetical protein